MAKPQRLRPWPTPRPCRPRPPTRRCRTLDPAASQCRRVRRRLVDRRATRSSQLLAAAMPDARRPVRRAVVDAARSPGPVRPSRRRCRAGLVPAGARRCGPRAAPGRVPGATFSGSAWRAACRCFCSREATAGASRRRSELRSGDRRRRILQPRDDRRLRREPRRVRALVLSPPVLGNRRRRAGPVPRGRGGGRARDRHRLFLRRSGARRAGPRAATRFKLCITSRSACRSRTRG